MITNFKELNYCIGEELIKLTDCYTMYIDCTDGHIHINKICVDDNLSDNINVDKALIKEVFDDIIDNNKSLILIVSNGYNTLKIKVDKLEKQLYDPYSELDYYIKDLSFYLNETQGFVNITDKEYKIVLYSCTILSCTNI